ncbi:hypothetical protein [uncultured Alistipes sp.]|uniref:hypothetical protein n=2 Tax=uncultured Alistipes sp. TaxID=538949 RepID=UPI0027D97BB6|nr:hypothetical protein [uncultured Alistipes sp.]
MNRNTLVGSVCGLADLMNIGRMKMRGIIARLSEYGLITSQSSNRGTVFQITSKGRRTLEFTTISADDFAVTTQVIRKPYYLSTLYIISKL